MKVVGRSCWSINKIYLLWSCPQFSRPLCFIKHWYYKENFMLIILRTQRVNTGVHVLGVFLYLVQVWYHWQWMPHHLEPQDMDAWPSQASCALLLDNEKLCRERCCLTQEILACYHGYLRSNILIGKLNGFRSSIWVAIDNMKSGVKRYFFFNILSLIRWFSYTS